MKLRKYIPLLLLPFFGLTACAEEIENKKTDASQLSQEELLKMVPRPVYKDQALIGLYDQAWLLAQKRVRNDGGKGLPTSPYMDEHCYETDIWIWDTVLMAMFTKYAPKYFPGVESLDNFYEPLHDGKMIPLKIHFCDNPPIFAWAEWQHLVMHGDQMRLENVLLKKQYLQKHFDWFNRVEKGKRFPFASNPVLRGVVEGKGFTWTGRGSGLDNTPRGRHSGGGGKILWVDAISQQALSALCIAKMYERSVELIPSKASLKWSQDAKNWHQQYQNLKQLINDLYWDEQDGFYYDVTIATGKPDRVKSIASYWALAAQVADQKQANRMIAYLKDEKFFGGKYPLTSLSRDDKDFNAKTGDYWRGGIWLPSVYITLKAIEKYGYQDLADELAEKVVRQQLAAYHQVTPHTIWECYSPSAAEPSTEHGRRSRPDFCGWSALGPISLFIENILGFRKIDAFNNEIHWDINPKKGEHGLRNLQFGEVVTDLVYANGKIATKSNIPYSLFVNGKKYSVPAGVSSLEIKK